MEIIGKTESSSFYNNKRSVYGNVTILEKRVSDPYNPKIEQFKNLAKGESIGLKYVLEDPEAVVGTLVEPVIRFTIYDTEESKDHRTKVVSLKYLFKGCQYASFFGGCD